MIHRKELEICMDPGNGFCKITDASGNNLAIAGYIEQVPQLPQNKITNDSLGFYFSRDDSKQPVFAVGDFANTGNDEEGGTNGLYAADKTKYYLEFLASIFGSGEFSHVAIPNLYVTVPPKANIEKIKSSLTGFHKILFNGSHKSLSVNNVVAYYENDASGLWIAKNFSPSKNFLVVQCGRGTTHMSIFNRNGTRVGNIHTLPGESKLIHSVQKTLASIQNLMPDLEDVLSAYHNSDAEYVYLCGKSMKWDSVFKSYKKAKSEMFSQYVLDNIPANTFDSIYFSGGAASTFGQVKNILKHINVVWEYDIPSQFMELEGLKTVGKNI